MSYASKEQIKELMEYVGGNLHLPQLISHFDKSNIYDTDEKLIGQWIDGKPLYQKTFTGSIGKPAADNKERSFATVLESGIDSIAGCYGYFYDDLVNIKWSINGTNINHSGNPNVTSYVVVTKSNDMTLGVQVWPGTMNITNIDYYLAIQYTKVADSPLSYKLGTENDYLTEERLIGTWIDGKPVYQKTMLITSPSTGDGASEYYNVRALVDSFVSIDPYINVNGTYINVNSAFAGAPSDSKFMRITGRTNAQTDNPNTIRIQNWTTWVDCPVFCTIKYTKV